MTVEDLIGSRQEVFSITPETTVLDTARYLRAKELRAVAVCDAQGRPLGIVSQSDISEKVTAENQCPAWVRASEIMSKDLVTVNPETPLEQCLQVMENRGIFHLLVLDERAGYRGLISAKDLLKVIAGDSKKRAETLESYMFPRWA